MADKEFKSIDEQLSILQGRGLNVHDEEIARNFLLRNNYYRVSGYSLTLRSHDVFFENATFQNIIDIYSFDQELRHVLLRYLELIEVSLKSVYSYEFAKAYGPVSYLDYSLFSDEKEYAKIMSKADEQKKTRLPHEAYLKHFVNDLQQSIPIWAFVDLLTISDISFLYKISPATLKIAVANSLGLNKKGDQVLSRFMHHMTIIRNLCAHGSRLYNRLFEQKPWLNKSELALLEKLEDGTVDNAHLYGFILVMRRLLTPTEFANMKADIIQLTQRYPFVNLRYYGFRSDWMSVL